MVAKLLKFEFINSRERSMPVKLHPAIHECKVEEVTSNLSIDQVCVILSIKEVLIEAFKT